ncbi:Type 1 glutamine amidotransferase-like domain-containing protein [Rhodococcus sovatensis]|uniref:Type 1 glutamine amidotransferase-like domain-containing protein n=1 Tax=Rhodococcus sovatensis TaxID=1805840 RepID=A0ABZ2PHQ1_9NOCA
MKLFLASYRFGAHADEFVSLTSGPGRVAVIANAADSWPEAARLSAVTSELHGLRELGYEPKELDLRNFVGRTAALEAELDSVDTVWLRGGNTFVLRSRLHQCGADEALVSRVRDSSLVFAGYSAGACVASASLRGIEAADDPTEVTPTTGEPTLWTGLGLVDIAFVPHFRSILDEHDVGDTMVERYHRDGVEHLTLDDDQVYVVDGDRRGRI